MPKYLLILESPNKIKTVEKILGPEYELAASIGHCVDLPPQKISVNLKKDFEPNFEVLPDKKKVLDIIKKKAKGKDTIYIFTDEDREGCGIGYHIANFLDMPSKIKRAKANAITKNAIQKAIAEATSMDVDTPLVNAYLTRRILDRICGYRTSFLTFQATGGKSAGRVQSALLRLIVEREEEIRHFVPQEYWVLTAHLLSSESQPFDAILSDKIKVENEKQATQIYNKVIKGSPVIDSVESKEVSIKPFAPFTTLPMLATASTVFGWPVEKTQNIAQSLYHQGHCTYIRTDSPAMVPEAVHTIRTYVDSHFGNEYVPSQPHVYSAKKGAQEAHECIRPTSIENKPALTGDLAKLYDLIWRRAVSSQMSPGRDRRIRVVTKIAGYDFISNGNIRLFDGFRRIWNLGKSADLVLPDLKRGEKCQLNSLDKDQHFTKPPPRFSDSSLSKSAEKYQITRPATFANSVNTLKNRKYVERKKGSFHPTEVGMRVISFLREAKMCFVDLEFTSHMEQLLDEIQENKRGRVEVLKEFWDRLKTDIKNGRDVKQQHQQSQHLCPKCDSPLLLKHSRFGPFYACSKYKKGDELSCLYTAKVGDHGEPIEKVVVQKEYMDFACNKCGSKMIKRKSKHGEFAGCSAYPSCKTTASLEGEFYTPKKKKWSKKKDEGDHASV